MRFSTLLYSSSAIVVFALVGAGALVDAADGAVASAALAASAEVEPALLARSDQGLLTLFLPYPRVNFHRSTTDSTLVARARGRGGNQGFQNLRQALHQIEDPNLNPGNAPGQGQNSGTQGIGQKSINGTSGLPNGIADMSDPQKNLFLDPSQIADGLASDGSDGGKFTPSLTSTNNYINFCLTRNDLPLTNGNQVKTGSCNAVPMGIIAAANSAPASKFVNPKNLDVIPPNQDFTIEMAINNLETGNFVNAQTNYFSGELFRFFSSSPSPRDLHWLVKDPVRRATNAQGQIIGHSHVVIELIDSLTSTTVTDPTKFAFFKGLNDPAQNGVLSATVPGGLPAGVYKMSSINAAANHQPVLVGVAQHGSLDDAVYFTVSSDTNANDSGTSSLAASGSTASTANELGSASSSAASSTATSTNGGRQRAVRSRSDSMPRRRLEQDAPGRRLEKRLAAIVHAEQL
ncbi:hypothetical protein C6P46_007004 [Rhodotorula mucilaginosa]|uniref:Uncharacterized protein n=1 Tax=Rhodotorula mucilaginosa TaxID=5537 RepID=A0A9P6VV86_RHOMI|nr:hypothetical protein C6P46_007004 [Rhodotorula mucilaginosa]